ncbi:hypothetical protein BR93DRAFT_936341 [Coniochaeta sp. PMI_546]|nr:hypothetical protein BR93DRAFT_936341 [Coniochaeta sp. PMI_546]
MTKMALGPSLPQARGADTHHHQHNHRHLHSHIRARHHHHSGDTIGHDHIHSHETQQQEQPHQRDVSDLDSNLITEVVETVSVVQVVDGSGSQIEIKTYFPDSAIKPDSSDIGVTAAGPSIVDPAPTTAALPSGDDVLPPETATDLSMASTLQSSLSGSGTLTSAPSSTFSSFPSLSGVYNATSRPSFNSTGNHSLFANTTTASIHSNTSFSFSLSTTSYSSSTLLTLTTEVPTTTVFGNGDGTGAGAGAGASGAAATLTVLPSSTSTNSSTPGGPLDPTTSSIVGGIVGGFAGIALVALAILIAVKWKRQHGKGIQLLTDGEGPNNRGQPSSSGGGPGGPGGGRGSWAIPAALASLTGYKQAAQATIEGPETSEKGFYRVSGRKLTSVLQSGGDGYGEPSSLDIRASTISASSFYRPDSIAMFSDPKTSPLQLGSPMRPESGIMIMRSGPARTPVEEQGPVFDDTGPLTPPASAIDRDPLGRSLLNQSGSGTSAGSPSRFTERIP